MVAPGYNSDIKAYLDDIGRWPLLGPEETKRLAWRQINDNDPQARDRLIASNLRLVVALAAKYMRAGASFADLVSEGNAGLIRAVEKWDPARGTRFSTYAAWWIKQAIRKRVTGDRQSLHIPTYMVQLVAQLRSAEQKLERELGRPPTGEELRGELKVPNRTFASIQSAKFAMHAPIRTRDDSESTKADFRDMVIETFRPETPAMQQEEWRIAQRALENMEPSHARVIKMRFGLEGHQPMTLAEIGRRLGLTRESIRLIEQRALRCLKSKIA